MKRAVTLAPLAPTPRPSNPTPLELAIHRFEEQARAYHHKKAQLAATKGCAKEQAEVSKSLDRDLAHLQRERIRISTHAKLQLSLEEYRAKSKSATPRELATEAHHPAAILAKNLTAVAEPKPSPVHDPHHIILGTGRWLSDEMAKARMALHIHGIGINDPINGVWLPRTKQDKGHWATPDSPAHKEIHRFNYERWLTRLFGGSLMAEMAMINRLRNVKSMLKFGGYPPEILLPKSTNRTEGEQ